MQTQSEFHCRINVLYVPMRPATEILAATTTNNNKTCVVARAARWLYKRIIFISYCASKTRRIHATHTHTHTKHTKKENLNTCLIAMTKRIHRDGHLPSHRETKRKKNDHLMRTHKRTIDRFESAISALRPGARGGRRGTPDNSTAEATNKDRDLALRQCDTQSIWLCANLLAQRSNRKDGTRQNMHPSTDKH